MASATEFRRGWVFLAVTLGFSFLVFWGPIALAGVKTISFVDQSRGPVWAIVLFMIGGFTPSLVAIGMTGIHDGRRGLRELFRRVIQMRLGWRWYLAAIVIVGGGAAAQVGMARAIGNAFDPSPIFAQLGSAVPLIILGPLSEELGWRGYAQERLQTRLSPLVSSLVIGVVWGLWHLPLFFIAGASQSVLGLPFWSFLVGVTSASVIMGWLYANTGGSIWSAVFFHWIYTYAMQVISSGVERSPLYNRLEYVPFVFVAVVVALVAGSSLKRTSSR